MSSNLLQFKYDRYAYLHKREDEAAIAEAKAHAEAMKQLEQTAPEAYKAWKDAEKKARELKAELKTAREELEEAADRYWGRNFQDTKPLPGMNKRDSIIVDPADPYYNQDSLVRSLMSNAPWMLKPDLDMLNKVLGVFAEVTEYGSVRLPAHIENSFGYVPLTVKRTMTISAGMLKIPDALPEEAEAAATKPETESAGGIPF